MKCLEQYVVSAIKFKGRLRIHKSDIKTRKDHYGTARHFISKCCNSSNPFLHLHVQLIEKVYVEGMNSTSDLYSVKRKCCRKH